MYDITWSRNLKSSTAMRQNFHVRYSTDAIHHELVVRRSALYCTNANVILHYIILYYITVHHISYIILYIIFDCHVFESVGDNLVTTVHECPQDVSADDDIMVWYG